VRLVIIAVLATLPEIAHADMRIAIGNDVFTPPIDDNGFTNVEAAAGGSVERFHVGVDEDSSGEPFAVVAVTIKQAGGSF
jgi:hypothetical protein